MVNAPSHRWFPVAATIALVTVFVIAAVVVLPYPGKTTTVGATTSTIASTTTSLQASFTTLSSSDYNSYLGLNLTMSIAPTTVSENDGVSIYVSLNNTLANQNNLTRPAGRDLPLSSYETCSQLPVGAAIFRGNYDVANASQGESLGLISPNQEVVNGCTGFTNSWSLAPMSDVLTYPPRATGPDTANATYWGYWTYDKGDVFRPFSPGIYTIEGQDLWGQATIIHFQVVENESPLDCATIATNSSFVGYANGSAGPGPLKLDAYYKSAQSSDFVFALTNTANSTLAPQDTASFGFGLPYYSFFIFSPDSSQPNTWQYYATNGTLGYPAFFYPDQCVLTVATFSPPFTPATLTLGLSNNQTQTFTIDP